MQTRTLFLAALVLAAGSHVTGAQPLKTAVDGTFAPHAFPKLSGGVQGFNVDLAHAIAERLGRELDLTATQWSGILPGLQAGTYDFVAAPTTVTEERAQNLLFTEGYLNTDFQFLVKQGAPKIDSLEGFKDQVISVNKGSAYDKWARDLEGEIGWQVQSFGSQSDAVQAVLSGRAFANVAGKHRDRLGGETKPAAGAVVFALHRPGVRLADPQGLAGNARPDRERHRVFKTGRHHRRAARKMVRYSASPRFGGGDGVPRLRRTRPGRLRPQRARTAVRLAV